MKALLTTLILTAAATSFAEIRETNQMSEAFRDLREGDVVVLDIDNTILAPNQTLGSDQWFSYRVSQYVKSGSGEKESVDKAIQDWTAVQNVTRVHRIEKSTPSLIQDAQRMGLTIFALTARPVSLKYATVRQLKSQGVQFVTPAFYADGDSIETFRGVLFVGPHNNKGVVLAKFLESRNIKPSRVIFVDDKEKHVKNMDVVFAKIPNINFRYGAADLHVKAFSAEIANLQWDYFANEDLLLTDAEARKLLKD